MFRIGLPVPIFLRKKFKKFWHRRFQNGYRFTVLLVGFIPLWFTPTFGWFVSSNFFEKKI